MTGWVKNYADGSKYIGEDKDVSSGKASWTRSSFQGIISVDLVVDGLIHTLTGPGEFWQSDGYESVFPGGSKLVKRRIQKLIENDKWLTIEYNHKTGKWSRYMSEGKL